MSRLRLSHHDHIAHVTLTRAEKKNAMDDEMIDAIIAAGEDVAASSARAVVLSGEGSCFCAGIDIAGLSGMVGQDIEALVMPRTHGMGTTNRWQEVAMIWHRLDIPVIAALHGVVFGAGLQLALGADIRLAAPGTQVAVMEMKWGLIPDMGGMVLLPRLVRDDVMKRMIYTAAPIPAEQAAAWGLVTEVVADPLEAAQDLATQIAGNGPNAIRAAKSLCAYAHTAAPADVLKEESRLQVALLGKPEQMEVIAAQFAKRAPDFG
ncbi:crotonase/enoyl-CoA hydratase family protein [Roseobacter denitrificans]|uniref:Enoyl-CoA hydratase/isomerase n=1 Tax=Roseobacter denitrificans (strain ATCC 33942 / OCh 114) TaxID=375451 RepID=Q169G9_ROSDO|nr:crotonase/enoyl-CoA hydratase family protein [Roseobacter denitrificans]ABG31374.1 enoyl-CoA hydratase/isomerase [Roseobacter denitrificans OCh 114]AVL54398.1 crotonase/enoyl-CoA hydratase family protein [Roseobacter denitrificans]SFG00224.1 Enoyl-CoA hydratase/carnithine racemase [Roseobacter denitrificans OCh 114]